MGHVMTSHESSAAPTRGASEGSYEERLPQAYVELLTLLEGQMLNRFVLRSMPC